MKKIYTYVAFAAMAISSQAQTIVMPELAEMNSLQTLTRSTEISMPTEFKSTTLTISRKDAPQKAGALTSIEDFAGEYDWQLFSLTGDAAGPTQGKVMAYVDDAASNTIGFDFSGISSGLGISMVKGVVDFEKNTLTLANNQYLGLDPNDGSKLYFYLKEISADGTELIDKDTDYKGVSATISGTTITFPELEVFAFGTPENEQLGWYLLTCNNILIKGEDLTQGWEYYCDGTFIDGWMTPAAGTNSFLDPEEYPYTVTIQKFKDIDTRYRIIDPYSCNTYPFLDVFNARTGYIIFDISDPDFVMVEPGVPSGVAYQDTPMCNVNLEGYFYFGYGGQYTTSEIKNALIQEDPSIEFSTLEGNTVFFNNCMFLVNNQLGIWDESAEPYMHGSLVFEKAPGHNAVETISSENAPVEFYNLQGVRVASDVKGLVIRHQGSKSEKVYIK